MTWPTEKLGSLVTIKTGRLDANAADVDGLYPFFTCSREPLKINSHAFDCDAILIAGNGDLNVKHYNGKFNAYQRTYVVTSLSDKVLDTRYLFYFMDKYVERLRELSIGGVIKYIKLGMLTDAEIPLPPLAEQQRIAAILDKADAIRCKRQQAIQLADDFLRAVFLDMFGDPVTNPKGFDKAPITTLADIITGFAFKSKDYVTDSYSSVRLCRGANTLTGYFDWGDTVFWPKNKIDGVESYLIKEGDVILAMDRPWISSGLKVCIFPSNERDTYLVQRVARLRPTSPTYTDYIYSCIKSGAFEKHCCPTETTVPHISPVELKNFEVLIPKESMVMKYHNVVSRVRASLSQMKLAEQLSKSGIDALSQKAFRGEL